MGLDIRMLEQSVRDCRKEHQRRDESVPGAKHDSQFALRSNELHRRGHHENLSKRNHGQQNFLPASGSHASPVCARDRDASDDQLAESKTTSTGRGRLDRQPGQPIAQPSGRCKHYKWRSAERRKHRVGGSLLQVFVLLLSHQSTQPASYVRTLELFAR